MNKNWVIYAVDNGFYFFGNEVTGPDGFMALREAAMFGGFGGEKGLPGVAKGHPKATVTLDRFEAEDELVIPQNRVVFIAKSINLYEFKGTTIRG